MKIHVLLATLLVPALMLGCKSNDITDDGDEDEIVDVTPTPTPGPDEDLPPEITDGMSVLATNPNVEKFLTEVDYPDNDWSYSKVLEYYGGFNGVKYDENGNPDENGKTVGNPKSDKPCEYTIRWTADDAAGDMVLHLAEGDWAMDQSIDHGESYVAVTNLVPNATYTYSVTAESGKVMTSGSFTTTGHLHQVFFRSGCRNGRDLGGWKTTDGKTVRYHKIYRGGRMQSSTLSPRGKREVLAEGIRAQLDLRGHSDVLSAPAFNELDFCAPVIEQGGTTMLKSDAAKTKECFDFVLNSLRAGKPVYYHCSLGRDRTGTLTILLLGALGVREGDISKEYEVTYFAPRGYSIAESESSTIFKNTRTAWVYSDVAPYFWSLADGGTFADGVQNYLLSIGVPQSDIDEYRSIMLE